MQNGGEESLVVYGNLKIPKNMLSDSKANGKKFKNYIKDISIEEEKQNKIIDNSTKILEELKPITSFDKLKVNSHTANTTGATMKLKGFADKKREAALLQKSINETAEEYGIVADDLAKGNIKKDKGIFKPSNAKDGYELYQDGGEDEKKTMTKEEAEKAGYAPSNEKGVWSKLIKEGTEEKTVLIKEAVEGSTNTTTTPGKKFQGNKSWAQAYKDRDKKEYGDLIFDEFKRVGQDQITAFNTKHAPVTREEIIPSSPAEYETIPGTDAEYDYANISNPEEKEKLGLKDYLQAANTLLPQFRPSDQSDLDYNQLYPEMSALGDKVDPVQAQGYRPQLDVPYDISLQDKRNDIISAMRSGQKLAGYNPAVQAMIASGAYDPLNTVNAEEFRLNQAKKDAVYSGNRATMNEARLKNLGIFDKQYERQTLAKSNTKATKLAALSSISDKFAKHKLENKTLGIYENLYNYRFDKDGRAINMNPLATFDTAADSNKMTQAEWNTYNAKNKPKKAKVSDSDTTHLYGQNGTNLREAISRNGNLIVANNGTTRLKSMPLIRSLKGY